MSFNVADGKWTKVIRNGYVVTCCGCGIEHALDIRLDPSDPNEFEIRVSRDADMIHLANARRAK